jgi:hypothetical protein
MTQARRVIKMKGEGEESRRHSRKGGKRVLTADEGKRRRISGLFDSTLQKDTLFKAIAGWYMLYVRIDTYACNYMYLFVHTYRLHPHMYKG